MLFEIGPAADHARRSRESEAARRDIPSHSSRPALQRRDFSNRPMPTPGRASAEAKLLFAGRACLM